MKFTFSIEELKEIIEKAEYKEKHSSMMNRLDFIVEKDVIKIEQPCHYKECYPDLLKESKAK